MSGGGIALLNKIYPIGSIYVSTNNVSPASLLGGTWTPIRGKFLLSESDDYTAGAEGGSANAVVVQHRHTPAMTIADWSDAHWQVTLYNGNYDYVSSYFRLGGTGSQPALGMPSATGYSGEDGTGKNMPPYLAVYMWQRTE